MGLRRTTVQLLTKNGKKVRGGAARVVKDEKGRTGFVARLYNWFRGTGNATTRALFSVRVMVPSEWRQWKKVRGDRAAFRAMNPTIVVPRSA